MKKLTIFLMKVILKRTEKKRNLIDNVIVGKAYDNMIKNYKDTIMYLNAQK